MQVCRIVCGFEILIKYIKAIAHYIYKERLIMIEYKAFSTPKEVTQWVSSSYSPTQLSKLDVKNNLGSPLSDYKGNAYRIMNQYLRDGYTICNDYDIDGLQAILLSCSLPDSIVTYRYVSKRDWLKIYLGTMFGKIYQNPIFLSTTLLKKYYSMEEIKVRRICIKIYVPMGAPGTYIPEVNPNSPEFEVLFAHHSKLKRNGFKGYHIILR